MTNERSPLKKMVISEIAERFNTTPSTVSLTISAGINHMVEKLMSEFDIFDIVIALALYLGTDVEKIYKKLDNEKKRLLRIEATKIFGLDDDTGDGDLF